MSELDVIIPAPVVVQVAGQDIKLYPLKVRQLPLVVRVMRPFFATLSEGAGADAVVGVYCDHADTINEALAGMSGLSAETIGDLPLDEGLALFLGCLEVNRDFFTKALPSLINRLAGGGSGPTP